MASSKDRERELARAKLERQLARRAARARAQRQLQARIGAGLALLLVLAGIGWATDWYGLNSPAKPKPAAFTCSWLPADTTKNTNLVKTGTPPATGMPTSGVETMAINTNQGLITAELDVANAPCTAASFSYLASKNFFDNSSCHRLTTTGIYVLQCGDPSATGQGGPEYTFDDENLPVDYAAAPGASSSPAASGSPATPSQVIYPAGTLAMANSGADTNGSQFFIVYKDSPLAPNYTVFGQITAGIDFVNTVAKAGAEGTSGDGKPKTPVTIKTLTVSKPTTSSTVTPSTAPSPSATS